MAAPSGDCRKSHEVSHTGVWSTHPELNIKSLLDALLENIKGHMKPDSLTLLSNIVFEPSADLFILPDSSISLLPEMKVKVKILQGAECNVDITHGDSVETLKVKQYTNP